MLLALSKPNPDNICDKAFSAIHGSIGHPSGPTKIILIYTPNEFLILTAYLLRELERILQGVVDCNE